MHVSGACTRAPQITALRARTDKAAAARAPVFTGSLDCARQTIARKGVRGLYRGVSSFIAFGFPRTAVRYTTFGYITAGMQAMSGAGPSHALTPLQSFLGGMLTGVVESLAVNVVMTTVMVRMIADSNEATPRFRGLFHAVRELIAADGWRGIYTGVGPSVAKNAMNGAMRFLTYNEISGALGRLFPAHAGSSGAADGGGGGLRLTLVSIASGAMAGSVSAIANQPIDVIKSNVQSKPPAYYTSSIHCARTILEAEGVRGFFKGMAPRLVRVSFEVGLSFTFFEHVSRACNTIIDGRP